MSDFEVRRENAPRLQRALANCRLNVPSLDHGGAPPICFWSHLITVLLPSGLEPWVVGVGHAGSFPKGVLCVSVGFVFV